MASERYVWAIGLRCNSILKIYEIREAKATLREAKCDWQETRIPLFFAGEIRNLQHGFQDGMVMRKVLTLLIWLALCGGAAAEEIDGEVNLSMIDPYQRLAPGFCGSYRPDLLQWRRLSLGGGLAMHISSRFNYETTNAALLPDSTDWYYYYQRFIEVVNFDFFGEARWAIFGADEPRAEDAALTGAESAQETRWKGWLTLTGGVIVNSGTRSGYLTNYQDSVAAGGYHYIIDFRQGYLPDEVEYRTDAYLSPGLLIGIGKFIVGYRHWFYFDHFDIAKGEPARMVGTLRLGYRFTW